MIDLREIRSVTEFQRNIKDYVGRLMVFQAGVGKLCRESVVPA